LSFRFEELTVAGTPNLSLDGIVLLLRAGDTVMRWTASRIWHVSAT
jgi:hypothetical protein